MRSGYRLYASAALFTTGLLLGALIPALMLAAGPALAGTLDGDFVKLMNQTPDHGTLRGIVTLSEQPDAAALEQWMARLGIHTRWARHEYVVRYAQELAARTQPAVMEAVQVAVRSGRVRSAQSFWVTNAIALDAEPGVFLALSQRGDVGIIFHDSPISLRLGWDEPPSPAPPRTGGIRSLQDGLVAIQVEGAWNQGYTGAGRLVCDFDTGADGNHPAYASRWRGAQEGVSWSEAWKDPYGLTEFPYDSQTHGTHTLGIMVAHPPGGDPLGVAPDAQWIAAGILIGYNVSKIIECYQWAVDPDGNPETINDVPDVINNSWGSSANCDSTYWGAIDLVEAAGIVNTIAVDNSGPSYASVNSPESRAASPYNTFSVGNINPHMYGYPIAYTSGRGPSLCDSNSIKPEVTAPGTSIYSTLPGGGYGNKTGTSMACPHTSGVVALLRQVNPGLTVEQVKDALMATAQDLGVPGEDNDYGWGLIDANAAVQWVLLNHPPEPSPEKLFAVMQSADSVRLTWAVPEGIVPANPLTGYLLYRAQDQDPFPPTPQDTLPAAPSVFYDTGRPMGFYRYVVTATYQNGGESEPSNIADVEVLDPVAVPEARGGTAQLLIRPNPFASQVEIRLSAPGALPGRIELFDAGGRKVRTLTDGADAAAPERIYVWDGRDESGRRLPAGAYFALVSQGDLRIPKRLVLLP